jgi:hypothetical protein
MTISVVALHNDPYKTVLSSPAILQSVVSFLPVKYIPDFGRPP